MKRFRITSVFAVLLGTLHLAPAAPLNIVLITADDLNWDSMGCNGATVPNITPHIDQLAREGVLFRQAHATIPVCQPVRATMSTGLYPARSGARGFHPIREDVTTMNEVFHEAGYLISMLAKNPHYKPYRKWCVDYSVSAKQLDVGRNPAKFAAHTRTFLKMAAEQGKPFFHHVNCQDPHRPFSWNGEEGREGRYPPVDRVIGPEEVEVPGFLEDLPEVRQEVADYFTCVHRMDACVGAVLQELKAAGREHDTLVMFFGGDHGMAFPFAKANVYDAGSRAALILRWPGVIPAGRVDEEHLVGTIDIPPTLLDAAELPPLQDIDGRSFLPIAKGEARSGWDRVFTMFHETFMKRPLEMRCVRTRSSAYIWNAWSDGELTYKAENMTGKTWAAMRAAAETDPEMRRRCAFYLNRVPEEYYVPESDPFERHNRIGDPDHAAQIAAHRQALRTWMQELGDPYLERFEEQVDVPTAP